MDHSDSWQCTSTSSSRRRSHGLKMGTCIGGFSHLFDWNRILGSKSFPATILSTPDYPSNKQERNRGPRRDRTACQGSAGRNNVATIVSASKFPAISAPNKDHQLISLKAMRSTALSNDHPAQAPTVHLRQLLRLQQEPFVLQTVIEEKKHPVRRKPERHPPCKSAAHHHHENHRSLSSVGGASSRSRSCRSSSKLDGQAIKARKYSQDYPGSLASGGGSCTTNPRRGPAETIISLPSSQVREQMTLMSGLLSPSSTCNRSSRISKRSPNCRKMDFPALSPPNSKSPSKRAIMLMEAAVRILEGSSRSHPARPSVRAKPGTIPISAAAVCSLAVDLDTANFRKKQKSREPSGAAETIGAQERPKLGEALASGHLQSRVFPYEARHSRRDRPSAASTNDRTWYGTRQEEPVDPSLHDDHLFQARFSRKKCAHTGPAAADEIDEVLDGAPLQLFRHRKSAGNCEADQCPTSAALKDYGSPTTEAAEPLRRCAHEFGPFNAPVSPHPALDDCRQQIPVAVDDTNSVVTTPSDAIIDYTRALNMDEAVQLHQGSPAPTFREGYVDCPYGEPVSVLAPVVKAEAPDVQEHDIADHARTDQSSFLPVDLYSENKVLCSISQADDHRASHKTSTQFAMLKLCDFSWWDHQRQLLKEIEEVQDLGDDSLRHSAFDHQEYLDEPGTPACVDDQLYEKSFGGSIDDSNSSGSATSTSGIEHDCQQFSPVSVLEAPFDDDSYCSGDTDSIFETRFEETRQQLLENVRRFELLAEMDLETLMRTYAEERSSSTAASSTYDDSDQEAADVDQLALLPTFAPPPLHELLFEHHDQDMDNSYGGPVAPAAQLGVEDEWVGQSRKGRISRDDPRRHRQTCEGLTENDADDDGYSDGGLLIGEGAANISCGLSFKMQKQLLDCVAYHKLCPSPACGSHDPRHHQNIAAGACRTRYTWSRTPTLINLCRSGCVLGLMQEQLDGATHSLLNELITMDHMLGDSSGWRGLNPHQEAVDEIGLDIVSSLFSNLLHELLLEFTVGSPSPTMMMACLVGRNRIL